MSSRVPDKRGVLDKKNFLLFHKKTCCGYGVEEH